MEIKKVSRRQFLHMGAIAVAGTIVAACAPRGGEGITEGEPVVSGTPSTPTRKAMTLEAWTNRGEPQSTVAASFVNLYNKQLADAGVPVQWNFDYYSEGFNDKIAACAAEGASCFPDVLFGSSGEDWLPAFIAAGWVPEHNSALDAVGFDWSDYISGVRRQLDGKDYWLPWGFGTWMQYLNLSHAEEAGLDFETGAPQTLDDVVKWSQAATTMSGGKIDRSGFLLTGSGGHPTLVWGTVLEGLGGQIVDRDTMDKPNFNNDAGREAAQFVLDCFDKHKISTRDVADRYKCWQTGCASVFWVGPWVMASSIDAGLNFATLEMPEINGQRVATDAFTEAMNLFDKGDEDRMLEGARLLKWFTENMGEFCTLAGDLCATKSGRALASYQNRVAAQYEVPVLKALEQGYARSAYFHPETSLNYYWGTPLVENLDHLWQGDWTVQEALDNLEAAVEEFLSRSPCLKFEWV